MTVQGVIDRARYDIGCLVPEKRGARREFDREFDRYAAELVTAVRAEQNDQADR